MTIEPTSQAVLGRQARVNGVEIAWEAWGPADGTALVLGHGFSGGAHDFALQIPRLARERQVIAFDHRGHGVSTKAADLASYSIAQLADDLERLLEIAAGRPVDLLGHSMGGLIALVVALNRPDLVRSLILMDTSAWSFEPSDPSMREMISGFLASFDPAGGLPDLEMEGPETPLIVTETPLAWRERRDELQRGFDPYALKALGSELFGSEKISVRPRLGELRCPVTVIVGSLDHPFIDQATELASEIRGAQLSVIEGAYHSPQLTHPEEWRAAVQEHLARLD